MAAPNGLSIFPLTLITNPVNPFGQIDNLNQLAELIATQCAPAAGVAPIAAGATYTITPANNNQVVLLGTAAGSVVTLPAATGTGNKYTFVVSTTVTSNSHKILAASTSDSLQGTVFTEDSGTTTGWYAALSSTFHSLQLNGTTTSGYQGDEFVLQDIATNVWQVNGWTKSTGTAATPFSTADS